MGIVRKINSEIEERYALLIGVDQISSSPKLNGVLSDLNNFENLLKSQVKIQYNIERLMNPTMVELRINFQKVCKQAKKNDLIFIYFSGFGLLDSENSFYMGCADSDVAYIEATSIESEFILTLLRKSLCENVVLIVDACHSGAFFNNNRGLPKGLTALTACDECEVAGESIEGGEFSNVIFNGIKSSFIDTDKDGKITNSDLCDYILTTYKNSNDKRSSPKKWEWNIENDIVLFETPKPVFISYQRKQSKLVQKISQSLNEYDLLTFVDEEKLQVGDDWRLELERNIRNCRAFIFVLDNEILHSDVATWELEIAHNANVPIFPILIDNCKPHAMFERNYGKYNRVVYDAKKHDLSIQKIVSNIQKIEIPKLKKIIQTR